jgi:hypothetical protein
MQATGSHDGVWDELRARRRSFWFIGVGGVFGAILIVLALSLVDGQAAALTFVMAILAYLSGFAWAASRLILFRCPRCDQRFFGLFRRPLGGWLFQKQCVRCGSPVD